MAGPLTTGLFDEHTHQGRYGEAFVRLLSAAAGLNAKNWESDVGIDWTIATPGPRGTSRSPQIEVQVKSWSRPTGSADRWHYPLRCSAYNHLAGPGYDIRHYLFLCIVPDDAPNYTSADANALVSRHAAYWLSLRDAAQDPDLSPESTKTVYVLKRNLLTVETLIALVEQREDEAVVA